MKATPKRGHKTSATPHYRLNDTGTVILDELGGVMYDCALSRFTPDETAALLYLLNNGYDDLEWEQIEPLVAARVREQQQTQQTQQTHIQPRQIVQWFAQQMERKLRARDHKPGWQYDDLLSLHYHLSDEVTELGLEVTAEQADVAAIINEAADVANMALMIAGNAVGMYERWRAQPLPDRPTMVCLCGSTRFSDAYRAANLRETLAGRMVLSIGCDFKSDDALGLTDDDKVRLDELHWRKIEQADEVLILNVDDYLGDSTRRELAHARALHKRVRWWQLPACCARDGETL